MTVNYPGWFPCVQIEGYTIDVDANLIRSKDRGLPAQRRVANSMPQSIKCKFTMSIRDWGYWQEWFTKTGIGWFWIDLPSMYAGLKNSRTAPHQVRLNSPVTVDAKSATHVTLSMTFEVAPSMYKQFLGAT